MPRSTDTAPGGRLETLGAPRDARLACAILAGLIGLSSIESRLIKGSWRRSHIDNVAADDQPLLIEPKGGVIEPAYTVGIDGNSEAEPVARWILGFGDGEQKRRIGSVSECARRHEDEAMTMGIELDASVEGVCRIGK